MTLNDFLTRLEGVKGNGNQYYARCPAHDDKHQSLSVSGGGDGQIMVNCHAGCSAEHVVSAMALTMKDLFPDKQAEPTAPETWKEVETYPYIDLDGKYAEKIRKESNTGKKSFLWRQLKERGGWTYNRQGIGHVLYNHVALDGEEAVFLVEGEKDVNAIGKRSKIAVCGADGAGPGKWKPEYTEQLRGKHVTIIPDNDNVGKAFAIEEATALDGVAASVRVIDLTTIWPGLPEHGDVSDLFAYMGDGAMDAISKLANETPEYAPGVVVHEAVEASAACNTPALVTLDTIEAVPPQYFWEPYLRKHNINLIRGDGGVGKSLFMTAIIAAVTTGKQPPTMPGTLTCGQGNVLYYGAEDDNEEYKHRAVLCGCDTRHLFLVGQGATLPKLSEVAVIRAHIEQAQAKLVVFDPVTFFLGAGTDMNKANEIRPLLEGLRALCREMDCTMVIVEHLNKATQQKAHYRGVGSVDFINASRSALMFGYHPEEKGLRVALHIKANAKMGDPIAYFIDGEGRFDWRGTTDVTEDEVANARPSKKFGESIDPVVAMVLALMEKHPEGWTGTASQMYAEGSALVDCSLIARPESIGRRLPGVHHILAKRGISWTKIKSKHSFSRRIQTALIEQNAEDRQDSKDKQGNTAHAIFPEDVDR